MIMDNLFKFPIVMIDGDNEERKMRQSEKTGFEDDEDAEIIIGEAEMPYDDFISITDRWLPTTESREKAIDGVFEACHVMFAQSGSFVVPWNKKRFKKELAKFAEQHPQQEINFSILAENLLEKLPKKDDNHVS